MTSEILINKLFAGKYLDFGENVGHEIINLFEADDGLNYINVCPGTALGNHEIEHILFVKHITHKAAEVIALATDLTPVNIGSADLDAVSYNGVALSKIFADNEYCGKADGAIRISYIAKRVMIPFLSEVNQRLVITLGNSTNDNPIPGELVIPLETDRKRMFGEAMRWYLSEETEPAAYNQLMSLLSDEDSWLESKESRKLVTQHPYTCATPTFLEVIRKEDDETVFSNLFAYYFNYSQSAFVKFAKEILALPDMDLRFTTFRERNHTDILIESENRTIVIENKLNAGVIAGRDGRTQLDRYWRQTEDEEDKRKNSGCKKRTTSYFLFAPDYRCVELTAFVKANASRNAEYKLVPYSAIYRFFSVNASVYDDDKVFSDFLRGLQRHTVNTHADLDLRLMRRRFLNRINRLKLQH